MSGPDYAAPVAASPAALACVLIADDLTGACDAAVPFAVAGFRARACLHPEPGIAGPEVLAISTDTRDADPSAAQSVVSEAARALSSAYSPSILFKKIDSTLRGNAKQEIIAMLSASGLDMAVVCPAFPKLHRIVESGCLCVRGSVEEPVDILERLRDPRLEPLVAGRWDEMGDAISRGARILIVDASSDRELDELVAGARTLNRRILWVGSGGLASALARAWNDKPIPKRSVLKRGPLVFCVGSDHAVTAAQQAHFCANYPVLAVPPTGINPGELRTALEEGRHVWIQIPRDPAPSQELGGLLGVVSPAAMLLSGGHTASLVCRAVNARAIDLRDEILPGIPYGEIIGGDCEGRIVVTKSGAFGSADALSRIADFFS